MCSLCSNTSPRRITDSALLHSWAARSRTVTRKCVPLRYCHYQLIALQLEQLAKKFRKNNISVDIVAFGEVVLLSVLRSTLIALRSPTTTSSRRSLARWTRRTPATWCASPPVPAVSRTASSRRLWCRATLGMQAPLLWPVLINVARRTRSRSSSAMSLASTPIPIPSSPWYVRHWCIIP